MRTFTLIACSLTIALSSGCEFIEIDEVEDTGDTTTDTDDGVDEDTGEDVDPEPEPYEGPMAMVRFIDVADGSDVSFSLSTDAELLPNTHDQGQLFFTQGTDYAELPPASWSIALSNHGAEVEVLSAALDADTHYTIAVVRSPEDPDAVELLVLTDDTSADTAVADGHSRLNWVHARPFDGTYAGQVYYDWGSVDQEWYDEGGDRGTLFIDPLESETWEYPMPTVPMYLFGQWGVPTDLPQDAMEVDAFAQVGVGELVNVFLTCTGACDPEDAYVLGQFEDGRTATTEGCQLYITGDDNSLTIEDC